MGTGGSDQRDGDPQRRDALRRGSDLGGGARGGQARWWHRSDDQSRQTRRPTPLLTANVSSSDADGDAITYSYVWNRNGTPIAGQTGSTLDLSLPGNGDRGCDQRDLIPSYGR